MSKMNAEAPDTIPEDDSRDLETTNQSDNNSSQSENPPPKPAPGRLPARAYREWLPGR